MSCKLHQLNKAVKQVRQCYRFCLLSSLLLLHAASYLRSEMPGTKGVSVPRVNFCQFGSMLRVLALFYVIFLCCFSIFYVQTGFVHMGDLESLVEIYQLQIRPLVSLPKWYPIANKHHLCRLAVTSLIFECQFATFFLLKQRERGTFQETMWFQS